jgi:hypothetical protein
MGSAKKKCDAAGNHMKIQQNAFKISESYSRASCALFEAFTFARAASFNALSRSKSCDVGLIISASANEMIRYDWISIREKPESKEIR